MRDGRNTTWAVRLSNHRSEPSGRVWELVAPNLTPTVTSPEIERWSPLKAWFYNLFNRNPKSNTAVIELLELSTDDRFLDIGCGPGAALEHAVSAGASVTGIDPSPAMVSRAAKRVPAAEVRVGSAEEIPFPDDSFSVAVNIASFHHWADREAGLKEILRVLAPGGKVHVVEGVLGDEKDGHGLSPRDAEILETRLTELGYIRTSTRRIKPGWRHEYFMVSGVAPEAGAPISDV